MSNKNIEDGFSRILDKEASNTLQPSDIRNGPTSSALIRSEKQTPAEKTNCQKQTKKSSEDITEIKS